MARSERVAVAEDRRHLVRGSLHLLVSLAVNGLGGFAFWWAAAGLDPADEVGAAQRLFTALLLVGYATSLGLPVVLARWAPDDSQASADVLRWCSVATTASSVVGALVLAAVAPDEVLAPLWSAGAGWGVLALAALSAGMSLAVLVEVRLISLRRWGWVIARTAAVVVARLPLLWVGVEPASTWALVLVAGAPALSGVLGAAVLHRRSPGRRHWWTREVVGRARIVADARLNYLGLLASQGPTFVVPFVVAVQVDGGAFAPFYLAWGVASVAFLVPHVIGQALLSEGSKGGARHGVQVRVALRLSVGLMGAGAVASFLLGPLLARLLGPGYEIVADLLPWLLAPGLAWAVTATAIASARTVGDGGGVVALTATFLVSSVVGVATLGAIAGVRGAAVGWALANVVSGVVAAIRLAADRPGLAVWPAVRPAPAAIGVEP